MDEVQVHLPAEIVGNPERDPDTTCVKETFDNFDELEEQDEKADIMNYVRAGLGNHSYVELYSKTTSELCRQSLMVVGYPKAGKTCLVDSLLDKEFRDTPATVGFDLSSCSIGKNDVEASEAHWNVPNQPLYQRIYDMLQAKFPGVVPRSPKEFVNCATELSGVFGRGEATGGENLCETEHENPSDKDTQQTCPMSCSEMCIWDFSGEFSFYSTQQMFLTSSSVFLLVMKITQELDTLLPLPFVTGDCASKLECPKTPREFLDYWPSAIGMFAGLGSLEDSMKASIVIVLTHTDLIDSDKRKEVIAEKKAEILKHVKSRYTRRYVHYQVFALSNKDRDKNELRSLKETVVALGQGKPLFGVKKPNTWLKLEADLLGYCFTGGHKYLPLKTVQYLAKCSTGMSFFELKSFLQFHHQYRNLIFTEDPEGSCLNDETYMNQARINALNLTHRHRTLVVFDPHFLADRFSSLVALWQFRNTDGMSLQTQSELDRDFERGVISRKNLQMLWEDSLDVQDIDGLVRILVMLNQLIEFQDFDSCTSGLRRRYAVPSLLPPFERPNTTTKSSGASKLCPVIYWFHQPSDPESGYIPVGFFFRLVS